MVGKSVIMVSKLLVQLKSELFVCRLYNYSVMYVFVSSVCRYFGTLRTVHAYDTCDGIVDIILKPVDDNIWAALHLGIVSDTFNIHLSSRFYLFFLL